MERKMAMVVNHVKMEDEDYLDVQFWKSKSLTERLAEVTRLRVNYYTWLNGFYPEKIEKVVSQRTL
ncbi:hypothetical protein [uncultured Mucilaginibacter sp.]|uniref:hypothetical protein n=1 Tax=uncultured Mucilaginibacter sp. TaxID=797541 RepID=UPI00261ED43F|nr:hypothetical protein [uncultured Mucilaginibacter sp.]